MRMNIEDSWLIARFQRFITEFLIEKQLGQRRLELTDELYRAWREIDQRGLKETPAPPLISKETEPIATLSACQEAA